jgi:hypothetical protein
LRAAIVAPEEARRQWVASAAECDILFTFEEEHFSGAVAPKQARRPFGAWRGTERWHRSFGAALRRL